MRWMAVWGRARYLSVTEAPHNTEFHTWMRKKHFVSFKPPRPGTEPRTLAWKAAVLTTTLGPPPNRHTIPGTYVVTMLAHRLWHWPNIVPILGEFRGFIGCGFLASRRCWPNAGITLAHRLRRRANIKPILCQYRCRCVLCGPGKVVIIRWLYGCQLIVSRWRVWRAWGHPSHPAARCLV